VQNQIDSLERAGTDSSLLSILASFRELGPPDLCHVIKTTGKAGQKDVSTSIDSPFRFFHTRNSRTLVCSSDGIISLRFWCRRFVFSFTRRLPQLAHLHSRGNYFLVLWFGRSEISMEDQRRSFLLVQRILKSRRQGRGQDSWRCRSLCR